MFGYLGNKNRGGRNNTKGNSFENFFAVYQIAKLLNEDLNHAKIFFSAQQFQFIDDLILEFHNVNKTCFYQIKDVQELDWGSGNNTIANDFEFQYEISKHLSRDAKLELMVSKKEVCDELLRKIPESLNGKVSVGFFSTDTSIPNLIRTNEIMKEALKRICALQNPATNKLEALATIILGVWDASDKQSICLSDLKSDCLNINPNYFKGFENEINEKLKAIFLSVNGFEYRVENGFIVWKYLSSDVGTLSFAIGTKEFLQWENDVLNAHIQNFDDLEIHLI